MLGYDPDDYMVDSEELRKLREYKEYHEFAISQLCDMIGNDVKTLGEVVEAFKLLGQRIDKLDSVLYDLVSTARRVSNKFGHDDDGVPSDWTEWRDLRDDLAKATQLLI